MNMRYLWRLTAALALLQGLGSFSAAVAQPAAASSSAAKDAAVKLEKFEVTGTRLSGATAEGALSVSLYKMDDIILSGYSNISEMLRKKLPQYGGGVSTINEGFGNGGNGESTISLRDLPGSRTLFLLNGRRTNADLNLIPKAAIERVEILNDGASAIYGTDAVAGVVNYILKKDYTGAEVFGRYANTTTNDIGEQRFSIVAGSKIKNTSFTIALENSRGNSQFSSDRAVSTPAGDAVSGTSNPGVFTPRATTAETTAATAAGRVLVPLRWYVAPKQGGTGLTAASQVPSSFNPSVFLSLASTLSVQQRNAQRDAEEARLNGVMGASSPVRYGANAVLMDGVNAGFPYGYYTLAVRPHDRTGLFLNTQTDLTEKMKLNVDFILSRNQSENNLAPSPLANRTLNPTNYWYNSIFRSTASTGRVFNFTYRPVELGPRITYDEFEENRLVASLTGQITKGWDYQIGIMNDQWSNKATQTGGVLISDYDAALSAAAQAAAFNPFGHSQLLTTVSPVNPSSLIDGFRGSAADRTHQRMRQIDASVTGDLFEVPAGTVKAVVGAERRTMKEVFEPDAALVNGTVFPFNTVTPYAYSRAVTSYFFETEVPVIARLTLPLAARYERFSDIGGTGVKPRVAFRWEPIAKELVIRGSWAKGFVAPSQTSMDPNNAYQSFTELYNPVTNVRTQATDASYFVGNPNLKPAKSDSYLIGGVYSPKRVKNLSVGLNYYLIKETAIPFQSDQYIVNQWYAAGPTNASNPFGANATPSAQNPLGSQVSLNTDGSLLAVKNVGPINTGERNTSGIDIFGNWDVDIAAGKVSFDASWTRVLTFEMENFPGAGMINYLGKYWGSGSAMDNYGFPKWKGSLGAVWAYRDYTVGVNYSYVDGYKEDENDDFEVSSYKTFDVRGSYRLKRWDVTVHAGVNNVFDKEPPTVITSFENGYDRAIGDIRGRMWYVEVTKKF